MEWFKTAYNENLMKVGLALTIYIEVSLYFHLHVSQLRYAKLCLSGLEIYCTVVSILYFIISICTGRCCLARNVYY